MRNATSAISMARVLTLVTTAAIAGCSATPSAAPPVTPSAPAAVAASPRAEDDVVMGPTEGASADPLILAWQNDLLRAMDRDGVYGLFNVALVGKGAEQAACVALDSSVLTLSAAQRDAVAAVQARYASSPIRSTTRANLWVAHLAHGPEQPATEETASR